MRRCPSLPELAAEEVGSGSSVVGMDGRGSGAFVGCGIEDEGSGGVVSRLEDGWSEDMEDDGAGICDIERVGSGCFICSIEGDGEVCRLERGSCFIVNDAEDDDCGSFVVGIEGGGSGGAIFRFEDGERGDVVRRIKESREEEVSALCAATKTLKIAALYLALRMAKMGRTSVKLREEKAVCPAKWLMLE